MPLQCRIWSILPPPQESTPRPSHTAPMRCRSALLAACLLTLLSGPATGAPRAASGAEAATPSPSAALSRLLAMGTHATEVMDVVLPARAKELGDRLVAAFQAHPEHFRAKVAAAAEGEALAWDEKMGLTEAEYAEFLDLADRRTLAPIGASSVTLATGDGGQVLVSGGVDGNLDGLAFDLATDRVIWGTASSGPSTPMSTPASSPIGAFEGRRWSVEVQGVSVEVNLGLQVASAKTLLIVRTRAATIGIHRWDAPPTP